MSKLAQILMCAWLVFVGGMAMPASAASPIYSGCVAPVWQQSTSIAQPQGSALAVKPASEVEEEEEEEEEDEPDCD